MSRRPKPRKPSSNATSATENASPDTDESSTASPATADKSKPPRPRLPPRERALHAALMAVSGVLWFTACPNFDLWFFAWFAMVPVFWAASRAPSNRSAFLWAWLAGTIANAGGFYWISGLLTRFAHAPRPVGWAAVAAIGAYQGLIFALTAQVVRTVRQHTPLPAAVLAPAAMVTFEFLLPMIFPFNVAITQAWNLRVIQIADITGPMGITALLLMVNGALFDLLDRGRKALRSSLIALGILVAALGYGQLRLSQVTAARNRARHINVGVVQPNVRFDQKRGNREQYARRQLQDLQEQSALLDAAGAELILWPETAYPYGLPRTIRGDVRESSEYRIRRGFTAPLVFGALTFPTRGQEGSRFPYNTALMLDSDGLVTGRFDKTYLLIGGEYMPFRDTFGFIERNMPENTGQLSRGTEFVTLPFRTRDGTEYRLGPMICYEDILPSFNRSIGALHPHLLVNITNDSWFGDTSEPWEHLALAVYRAVEMRTDLVRSVNTGVSAFVDATGRVYARTYAVDPMITPRGADRLLARVALMEGGHTIYMAIGDTFAWLCVGATVYLWIVRPRRKRAATKTAA